MAYPIWTHRHVMMTLTVTVNHLNNYIEVFRKYLQAVISDCPFGPSCSIEFQKEINFWSTVYLTNTVLQPLNSQFRPRRVLSAPPVWVSNDLVEFNTPSSAFPKEIRTEPYPLQMNRHWEQIGNGNHQESYRTMRFTLISYNVLSQTLLDSNQIVYNSCRREHLVWEARWEKIFNEVLRLDPDVFCLQEVQASHLSYYAHFQSIGYLGVFKKKTRYKVDGCAVFYKDSKFEMIDKIAVQFRCEEIPFLRADNVGIIVKLAPRVSPNTHLVVATTHLLYMPDEAATRLAQMRILLSEIEKFAYDEIRGNLPMILTGDFNALPQSNVIKFLENRQICIPEEESLEMIGLSETDIDMNILLEARPAVDRAYGSYRNPTFANQRRYKLAKHPFKLSSVYKTDKGQRWATVDHIYFTDDVSVVKRLSPPTECMRRKIPNEIYGSDHMSIAAVFEIAIE